MSAAGSMAAKKILYVIATLDPHGAERQMAALAARLDRRRFQPSVCALTRGGPLEEDLRRAGVETFVLGKKCKLDLRPAPALARRIRRGGVDLVHTWLFTGNAFGRAAAALAGGCKIVASERSVDRWRGPAYRFVDRALARCTHRILANAEAVKRFLVEEERLPADLIEVIPNGVDLERFQSAAPARLREELGLPADAALIGCIARLEPQKGHRYLIDAAAEVFAGGARAAFLLVGAGPEEDSIRRQIQRAGLAERVRLLGPRSDIPEVLAALDALVLPSLWEGLPNVVLEAFAAGLPVAATAVDGTCELIEHERDGLLVPPRDPRALAEALQRLLSDSALRGRLAAAGQAKARRYSMERMVERTQAVYERLLTRP